MMRFAVLLLASLVGVASIRAADQPQAARETPERLLTGQWQGGPCEGNWTFTANGTFEVRHYTPASNHLLGTWEVRWNALPPTLVMTCKTTDDEKHFPVGQAWEVKLLQLDGEELAYQHPGQPVMRFKRASLSAEKELAALQGTWVPLQYEADGRKVEGVLNFKQIIKGDTVTFLVNREAKAEGKVIVDVMSNPKRLDFQFTSGQTDLIIYVRAGDYVTYCGNRDGQTRPSEFATGTAKGGEYLQVWKIER